MTTAVDSPPRSSTEANRGPGAPSASAQPRRTDRPSRERALRGLSAVKQVLWTVLGWIPITPFGLLAVAGLLVSARWLAGPHPDLIVLTIAYAGLTLCLVDVAMVLAAGLWLRFAARAPVAENALELESRVASKTGYRLGVLSWNPLLLYRSEWTRPAGFSARFVASRRGWEEEVQALERGRADRYERWLTVRDWFGIARVRFRRSVERTVSCLPCQGRAASIHLIEQFRPGDVLGHPDGEPVGDLIEMRRYVTGDPLKLVLWKAYARTGRMLVRTAERAVTPTTRTLAYLVAAEGDDPASGIVLALLEAGLLGPDVVFMADGADAPSVDRADAIDQIVRSVDARRAGGQDLDRFLKIGEQGGTSATFLFVSGRPGAWLDHVCRAMEYHPGPFRAVIGVDGIDTTDASGGWKQWLLRSTLGEASPARDVRRVRARLSAAGAEVTIVDRMTGESVPLDD